MKRPTIDINYETCLNYINKRDPKGLQRVVDEDPDVVNSLSYRGVTPLMRLVDISSKFDDLRMAKIIIQSDKFDTDLRDKHGKSSLHWAAERGRFIVIKYLIERGADVNAVSNDGKTPLMCITARGLKESDNDLKCLELLVNADGIDLDKSYFDQGEPAALSYTLRAGNELMTKMLIANGACVDDWQQWRFWSTRRWMNEYLNPLMAKWRSYLPQWTVFSQKYYPGEFVEICLQVLCLLKRLNDRNGARVNPDMRRLLLSFVADGWRQKIDKY